MKTRYIYDFDSWTQEQGAKEHHTKNPDKNLLGSKGYGLSEMSKLGLNVPPGFTISTDFCTQYYKNGCILPQDFEQELWESIERLERKTQKICGATPPLLLSVRSGSPSSMPGMMDTILNLGMNDEVMEHLADLTGNRRFALDTHSRFIKAYGSLVAGVKSSLFLEIENPEERIKAYKSIMLQQNAVIPESPKHQLIEAIKAVLNSWMSHRACYYRKLHNIPESLGTAVNIQSMVFGNMGNTSGTGVVFTRNPSTGAKEFYGEFLLNAQGEDIVSGAHTPRPITPKQNEGESLKDILPEVYQELKASSIILENYFLDMQDIEFTIEQGKLYILQTRSAKRTAAAAIKIVVDMVEDGKMTQNEAILKIEPESLNQLLHASIDRSKNFVSIAKGLPASPGAASGIAVFSPHDAEELSLTRKVILVRNETSPEDIHGMHVSAGILTARGGMTSHAAVVARGMGKPCICGVQDIKIDEHEQTLTIGDLVIKQGDFMTIDGGSGEVFLGMVETVEPEFTHEFNTLIAWADAKRSLKIRANADTAEDALTALRLGSEGIGLCRTEHMFFDPEKLSLMREMIVAPSETHRASALERLLPLHKEDFKAIFRVMRGLPINIRLLDPPLHEFLPQDDKDKEALAESLGLSFASIEQRLVSLHEVNPMLGHRGARLGITSPAIYAMQVEAIILAALELKKNEGITTSLEIMLPLIFNSTELGILTKLIKDTASVVCSKFDDTDTKDVQYKIGAMIELPRAALQAGSIAPLTDYFSFGTNDLTQTTYGISRDDVASFIPEYIKQNILPSDPFVTLDQEGVGELIKIAAERGKASNPSLKLGICGEHGGDTSSIEFFNRLGFDYVSCSPYRIPIARLAAAHAALLRR
ncbi:MAG: pyruvate, phosphate dikinase [Pseudomonadota bacterium]